MDRKTGLSESLEDYLETILALEKSQKVARVKDIADRMGVLRGSVTGAVKNLADKGLINYAPYSFITLTPKGEAIAREVTRRHRVIKAFLQDVLLLEEKQADENACRMEHAMDKDAIDRLVQFIEYIDHCPGPEATGWVPLSTTTPWERSKKANVSPVLRTAWTGINPRHDPGAGPPPGPILPPQA